MRSRSAGDISREVMCRVLQGGDEQWVTNRLGLMGRRYVQVLCRGSEQGLCSDAQGWWSNGAGDGEELCRGCV